MDNSIVLITKYLSKAKVKFTKLFLFVFLILYACSNNPSEIDAKRVLENGAKGLCKIVSFKKINGQLGEMYGAKVYIIEYEAEIELVKDTTGISLENIHFFEEHIERYAKGIDNNNTIKLQGVLTFAKTEKGWKGEDGNIY